MSSFWTLRLTYHLLSIAKDELNKNNYVVANLCLKIFTELMDSLIINSGLLHDKEYNIIKNSERLNLIKLINPDLLNDWNNINSLFFKTCFENNYHTAKSMIEMIENQLNKIKAEKNIDSFEII